MKNVSDLLNARYVPEAVLVAYHSTSVGKYFLESRKVLSSGMLGEGRPVSRKFIDTIVRTFSASFSSTPYGIIPRNMLYVDDRPGHKHFIWYNPPCRRSMTFAKSLRIDDGDYCVPGIIYEVKDTSLSVYAYKGRIPRPETKLYRYPSFNLYEDNHVCLGNAKAATPKKMTWQSLQTYWETMYWGSTNSHLIGGSPVKGNLGLILKSSVESFDNSVLIRTDLTLNSLMK